jgi:hypothetical protein
VGDLPIGQRIKSLFDGFNGTVATSAGKIKKLYGLTGLAQNCNYVLGSGMIRLRINTSVHEEPIFCGTRIAQGA